MNNFDFDDDLPFSPAYENEDEKKENENKVNSTDIANFFSSENVKQEQKKDETNEDTLNNNLEDDIVENYKDVNSFVNNEQSNTDKVLTNDNFQSNENDNEILENVGNYTENSLFLNDDLNKSENTIDVSNSSENLNKEDLFSLNLDDSDENIKARDLFKPDVKEETKKKKAYKNTKEYAEFVKKTSRVLPVVAFLFVSLIGVYVFVNKANADSVNLIKIEENSKTGYIDNSGEVIVKPKYLYGTDFYKGYAVVKNYNSLYGIIDGKGKNKIAFGNIFSATLYGNRYAVSKFTKEGLKMGLMTENLEELTRFKYDNITYSKSGVFIFTRDETMGVMNNEGKEIYTYKVDEVDDRNISVEVSNLTDDSTSDVYAKIKINSSSTIINTKTGNEVYKYTLDEINVLDNNVFYIKNKTGNNRYFVIKNDKVVYETQDYKRLRIESLDSDIAIGIKENASIDYINLLTKDVINNSEGVDYTYSDGVVLQKKYNFTAKKEIYTIYTPKKELGSFSDIKPLDNTYENDYMIIKTENNKYSFINKKGSKITGKEYETVSNYNKNGYAIVSNDNSYGVIDGKGKEIISLKYDGIKFLNDSLFKNIKKLTNKELFIFEENGKYGIIDSDGKELIKPIYDSFDIITTKYPIIKGKYNGENVIINLETFKDLSIKSPKKVQVYENYIISNNSYYNYNGEVIYTVGG